MKSNAQLIREAYKQLLDDGKPHSRSELLIYAKEKNPTVNYSEGMLTGALKTLTDPGSEYQNIGRALYQKVAPGNGQTRYIDKLIDSYTTILKDTVEKLENNIQVNPFELLELAEDDKRKMSEIRKCIAELKKTIDQVTK